MIAMATDEAICVLDFLDQTTWYRDQAEVLLRLEAKDMEQENALLLELEKQLKEYFAKERKEFTLPITLVGTSFQEEVWKVLQTIPYGETRTYKEQAIAVHATDEFQLTALVAIFLRQSRKCSSQCQ